MYSSSILKQKLDKSVKYVERDLEGSLTTEARYNLENKLEDYLNEMKTLRDKFDVEHFIKWVDHVIDLKAKVQQEVMAKFRLKFDWFPAPEEMSINNLCYNQAINLVKISFQSNKATLSCSSSFFFFQIKKILTNGNGFYQLLSKESLGRDRRIILRDMKNSGKICEDFTHKTCSSNNLTSFNCMK
jgi:hypothetical protein